MNEQRIDFFNVGTPTLTVPAIITGPGTYKTRSGRKVFISGRAADLAYWWGAFYDEPDSMERPYVWASSGAFASDGNLRPEDIVEFLSGGLVEGSAT